MTRRNAVAGVKLRVDVIGEEELQRKLRLLEAAVQGAQLAAAVTAGAELVQNAAKIKAPFRTGTLRRSIHTETVSVAPTRAEATVGTDVVYAKQVEFGGTIRPKKAKMLHWTDESGEHFARSVTQPARPYLRPAFDEEGDNAGVEVREALKVLVEKAAAG